MKNFIKICCFLASMTPFVVSAQSNDQVTVKGNYIIDAGMEKIGNKTDFVFDSQQVKMNQLTADHFDFTYSLGPSNTRIMLRVGIKTPYYCYCRFYIQTVPLMPSGFKISISPEDENCGVRPYTKTHCSVTNGEGNPEDIKPQLKIELLE